MSPRHIRVGLLVGLAIAGLGLYAAATAGSPILQVVLLATFIGLCLGCVLAG